MVFPPRKISFMPTALDGGERSASRPGRYTPGEDPEPIVQDAGWAPGPVWTGAENLAPTGIRSPDRSALSQYLNLDTTINKLQQIQNSAQHNKLLLQSQTGTPPRHTQLHVT
jgi:hypothetical protein